METEKQKLPVLPEELAGSVEVRTVSEKKIAANRRNALKSTGPKTAPGKARSSWNSHKHGMLTAAPIIPGIESLEAREEHRAGFLKSFSPVGHVEKLLTVRLAGISWRLSRAERYEAEMAAASIAAAELDLDERAQVGSGKPSDPEEALATVEASFQIFEILKTLPKMADGEKLDTRVAVDVLWALSEEVTLPEGTSAISISWHST